MDNTAEPALVIVISIHQMWRFRAYIKGEFQKLAEFQYIKCGGSQLPIEMLERRCNTSNVEVPRGSQNLPTA